MEEVQEEGEGEGEEEKDGLVRVACHVAGCGLSR